MISKVDFKKAVRQRSKIDSVFHHRSTFTASWCCQVLKVISIISINKDSHAAAVLLLNYTPPSGCGEEPRKADQTLKSTLSWTFRVTLSACVPMQHTLNNILSYVWFHKIPGKLLHSPLLLVNSLTACNLDTIWSCPAPSYGTAGTLLYYWQVCVCLSCVDA